MSAKTTAGVTRGFFYLSYILFWSGLIAFADQLLYWAMQNGSDNQTTDTDPLSLNLYTYCKNEPLMYSDPTGHNTLDDYEYQKKAEEKQTRSSSTLDNYAYQNQTRIAKDSESPSVGDYYYNKNASDAQLKAQTLEQQRPTITSTAKSIPDVCKFLGNVAQIKSDEYKNNLDPVFGLINSLYDAQFASFEKYFGVSDNTQGYSQVKSIYKFGVGFVEGSSSAVLDLANDFNKQNDPIYQLSHVIEMANSTVSLLNNPDQMNAIANAIYHPQQTLNAIGKGISTSFLQTISDPYKSGNFTGQATVFIAPFFIGAGEAGAASKAEKAEELLSVAAKAEVGIMEGTGEASSKLFELQNELEVLAETDLLPKYLEIDPSLVGGYTGSFRTGTVGNPNKATFGEQIDLSNFDIDYWIESDTLFQQNGKALKPDAAFRKLLSETPGFEGLKPGKSGFSIKFKPSDK